MLDRILKIEEQLVRAEALLLVISVLLMLGLATYNVFYRNVLVPIQVSVLTEDEPAEAQPEPTKTDEPTGETEVGDEPAPEDEGSGFGGGFGEDDDSAAGDSEGFGGGFGGDTRPEEATEPEVEEPEPEPDSAEGFGGGFGGDEPGDSEGFGGGFGSDDADPVTDTQPDTVETVDEPTEPKEIPWFAEFVDAVKLEWIDVLLRQLVLVVGFLGAMIAAQRRKHITIDALSKVLPEKVNLWLAVFTSALSTFICIVLAKAGSDLVKISIEFPKELVSWADEWHFQLAFPIGFGLLALHFAIRVAESLAYATGQAEPPEEFFEGGAV